MVVCGGGLCVDGEGWRQEYYWDETLMWAKYDGVSIKVIAIEEMRFYRFEAMPF